jgi:diguanylate cyclase (GGDEF)-like protein
MDFAQRVERLAKTFNEFAEQMQPEMKQQFGQLGPEQRDFFAKQLYHDTLVPGVGNKRAYQDFASRPRQGVHVSIDLNDFKAINDMMSYQHGDDAITAAGQALSEASRANRGKLFRPGGDEFRAYFETPEQAYSFMRHAPQAFSKLQPVGGNHKLSFSAGIAADPDQADQALHHAKAAKTLKHGSFRTGSVKLGHGEHFVHSLLPGAAGPVPVATEPDVPAGVGHAAPRVPMPMPSVGKL